MNADATGTGGTGRPEATGPIDIHAHHVDPDAVAAMARLAPAHSPTIRREDGRWWMDLPPGFFKDFPSGTARPLRAGLIDLDVRLADMDRQGIRTHVLSGYTYLNFYNLAGELAAEFHAIHNDAVIATARARPDRFIAFPGLPIQAPELAAAEVRRLAAIPEVAGLGIGSNAAGANLDDEGMEPLWAAIHEAGLPVLIHPPGSVAGAERMQGYHLFNLIGNPVDSTVAAGRIIFSGILDRYPSLRLCFVHGGGFVPYQLGRWDHGWRVREDTKVRISRLPSEYLAEHFYFDSLTHDRQALNFLGERVGWDRVMLGTDYPWDMATERPLEELDEAGLAGERLEGVSRRNALGFIRRPAGA
jgi:aminocarboxymuconate-semialdehyde decarboxylase